MPIHDAKHTIDLEVTELNQDYLLVAPPSEVEASAPAVNRTIHVVLPAFNEQQALGPLLESICQSMTAGRWTYEVTVVDDGSDDQTALVASRTSFRMPVDLVQHRCNQGLAATLRTGLMRALENCGPEDVIVTMDADNTHPPELIADLMERMEEGLDVVIASRYRAGARTSGVPVGRSLLSTGARLMFQAAFPIRGVRDYTCGYRAYRAGALQAAVDRFGDRLITEQGFSCMAELLLKLHKTGCTMGEVPLRLRYERRGEGSKMKVMRTVAQTVSLIVRTRFLGT